jgi:4-amino-4-deoxy-L-arabinose transferase-like glycosyltransferase
VSLRESRVFRASTFRLVAILFFALALRLFFFVGYANVDPWDDTLYLRLAKQAIDGTLAGTLANAAQGAERGLIASEPAFVLRRGAYLPIAFCQGWGRVEILSALPSLAASLGTLVLTYLIGYRLAGRATAETAALLYAIVPIDLVYSTRLLAGVPQTLWLTGSVAAAIEAARGGRERHTRMGLYIISGMSLYLAFFTRLNGLLGIPILFFAVAPAFLRRKTRLEPLGIVFVLIVAFLLDGLYYLQKTDSFFFAFRLEHAAARAMFAGGDEALFYPFPGLVVHSAYLTGVPHHFFKLFLGTIDHYGYVKLFSSFAFLGFLATFYSVIRRRLWVLVFWLLFVFFYNQYGFRAITWDRSEDVLHYYLIAHRPRYLLMLLPPLCVLLGYLISEIKGRSRLATLVLLAVLAGPSLYRAIYNHRFYRGSLADLRQSARFLLERNAEDVFTDPWGKEQLLFFTGDRLSVRVLDKERVPESGSWVVLGGSRGFDLASTDVAAVIPEPYRKIHLDPATAPETWEQVYTIKGPRQAARVNDLVIFRVRGRPLILK